MALPARSATRASPEPTEATIRAGIQGAINSNDGMVMGAYSIWTAQQISDVAAHLQAAVTPPPPPPFAPLPTPAASPTSVSFATTAVGSTEPDRDRSFYQQRLGCNHAGQSIRESWHGSNR